jgi:ADP-heptose:LPS heptosyltransferase
MSAPRHGAVSTGAGFLPPERVRRLFILRPDNLGDVVLFTGALRHLRAHYKNAQVTLCVRRYVAPLLEECPYVDAVIHWEDLHATWPDWTRRVRGLTRLELAIRRWQIRVRHASDVALLPLRAPAAEMHGTLIAIPARERYGIRGCHANQSPEVDAAVETIYTERLELGEERDSAHELVITREFLEMLGIEVEEDAIRPEFWSTVADAAWAAERVQIELGTTLLAIAPGVSSPPEKAYPPERYGRILMSAGSRPLSVVLLGGPADIEACAEVARSISGVPSVIRVTNLAGQTTVRQMTECIRLADAVLGADAAPMHVAIGLGRPTATIMGGGHFGRFHPWGDPERNRVVNRPMPCYGCHWKCRYPTTRCVTEIEAEEIGRVLGDTLSDLFAADAVLTETEQTA